ncbi:MAG: YihY family inner membrane protein [Zetaproteobacteria bacterium]|nr:MAG: YihY family inner membrane protein [Zetaproteobacteria bacterium]
MDLVEAAGMPVLQRAALLALRLVMRAARRFWYDQGFQHAAALAYSSLLAVVPLVVLGVSVFTSFPAFDKVSAHLSHLLLDSLVPTSRAQVERYLSEVTGKATALSIFGIAGLLVTAVALINTMEESFNAIWRITRARPLIAKFLTFWAVLTLSPMLVGMSITITSYFAALPILDRVSAGASAMGRIPFLLPWVISSLAMTSLYVALPNTSVPWRHAAVGGLVAGALFELTKFGFTFYVTELAHYEVLYGALGTLPVFLVWLYLVWVVVLFGAELTFCLQHPPRRVGGVGESLRPGERQFYRWMILLHAARAARQGEIVTTAQLCTALELPEHLLQEWLDDLARRGLLKQVDDHGRIGWIPARDAASLRLLTLHRILNPAPLEIPEAWRGTVPGRLLAGLYFRLARAQKGVFGTLVLQELLDRQQRAQEDAEGRFADEMEEDAE